VFFYGQVYMDPLEAYTRPISSRLAVGIDREPASRRGRMYPCCYDTLMATAGASKISYRRKPIRRSRNLRTTFSVDRP
jgi:hypothetical protein